MRRPLSVLDRMPFGKYRGELVGKVIEEDQGYILWLLENTDYDLDEEAHAYLKECS